MYFKCLKLSIVLIAILLAIQIGGCSSSSDDNTGSDGDLSTDGDNIEGDGDTDQTDGDADQAETPKVRVEFDSEALDLTLVNSDKKLMVFHADSIQLGIVEEVTDEANYDPFPLIEDVPLTSLPDGLEFLNVTAAELNLEDGKQVLALTFEKDYKATLTLEENASGSIKAMLVPAADSKNVAYFRLRPRVDSEEGFYGLGEYFDHVNHRGKIRAMQIEVFGGMESGYNEAHVPVPFIIGSTGWGLFVECPYPGVFGVANEEDDLIDVVFGLGRFSDEGLTFHLFAEDHPLDLTKHYYDITGYPNLPAKWALGPWIWRDENDNKEQVLSDLSTIRDLDLATTGYWIDRPYASGVNSFDFHAEKFPEPQEMIDTAHDLGMRMALWHTPYMTSDHESSDATVGYYDYAKENDYFPPKNGLLLNKWSKPIDYTNPDAYDWWQSLISNYTSMGIEGFKLDYAEDIVPGVFGARNVWGFFDGSDERTMHSIYQLYYHRVYAEMLPEDGGFLICRGGTYGDQKNVNVIWPGDLDASLTYYGEEGTERDGETYIGVGGLPSAMVASQTLGPSGFPFFGSDTGGYRHSPPDKETFTRWFQHTALSSVMQVGTSSNDVPWEGDDENLFDDEMLGWYRTYARLHLRLWPYEWTYTQNILTTGRPIQRSLGLAYPELGEHPFDTYMFGDDLLVAPAYRRDMRERDIILPSGKWADWWNGDVFEGDQTLSKFPAPLEKLPLFIREGGIVPLFRPTIDAIAPTTEPERVDSYSTDPGILYPRVFAGPASTFTLFDGCELGQEKQDGKILLSYKDGSEFTKGAVFELMSLGGKPPTVSDGDNALDEYASMEELEAAEDGWFYNDANGGSLFVKVAGGEHKVEVTL